MKVRETVCDSAVMRVAVDRMDQITELLRLEEDADVIASLQVECAALDGSWMVERWIDIPDAEIAAANVAAAKEQAEASNETTIRQQAEAALAGNKTYIGIASPTNAEVAAQVKALTRQNNKIIRLLIRKLDATD